MSNSPLVFLDQKIERLTALGGNLKYKKTHDSLVITINNKLSIYGFLKYLAFFIFYIFIGYKLIEAVLLYRTENPNIVIALLLEPLIITAIYLTLVKSLLGQIYGKQIITVTKDKFMSSYKMLWINKVAEFNIKDIKEPTLVSEYRRMAPRIKFDYQGKTYGFLNDVTKKTAKQLYNILFDKDGVITKLK